VQRTPEEEEDRRLLEFVTQFPWWIAVHDGGMRQMQPRCSHWLWVMKSEVAASASPHPQAFEPDRSAALSPLARRPTARLRCMGMGRFWGGGVAAPPATA